MSTPRQILDLLTRDELAHLVQLHGIHLSGRAKGHLLDRLEEKGPGLATLLSGVHRIRLAELCGQLGLMGPKDKAALVARLAGAANAEADPRPPASSPRPVLAATGGSAAPRPRGATPGSAQLTFIDPAPESPRSSGISPKQSAAVVPPSMPDPRGQALDVLPIARLKALVEQLDLRPKDRRLKGSFVKALGDDLPRVLAQLKRDELKEMCQALGIDSSGKEKDKIMQRILGEETTPAAPGSPSDFDRPAQPPPPSGKSPASTGDATLSWIANFIWGIADDVLRDLYVRGKYRDVILPMTVLRRLDSLLEPTKPAVLRMKALLDKDKIVHQDQALRDTAAQAFYNTSPFTLRDLKARASQQQLKADFEAYLDGFSPNVQDILEKFEFRNQIPRLSKADALGTLIAKLLSPEINLSPNPILNGDGSVKHPGLDNHGMGTIFEELVRRFNEENNEEAGEHWTPRDAVQLMAKLIFLPIAGQLESGTYLLYDGACGTGGMLTVGEETLVRIAKGRGKQVATHLYGQEINAETYAIAKADLLLKGEGDAADNLVGGPEHSTLSNDAFPSREFDFMLSNPPTARAGRAISSAWAARTGSRIRAS